MNLKIGRRQFLQIVSFTAASSLLYYYFSKSRRKSFSDRSPQDHFFILCTVPGGMDVTLGLDPVLDPQKFDSGDYFREYFAEDIIKKGNLALGPSCLNLKKHVDNLHVVNGISCVQDMGHEANLFQMSHGSTEKNIDHFSALAAGLFGPTPYGLLTDTRNFNFKPGLNFTNLNTLAEKFYQNNLSLLPAGISEILSDEMKRLIDLNKKTDSEALRVFKNYLSEGEEYQIIFTSIASSFATKKSKSATINLSDLAGAHLDHHSYHEKNHLFEQRKIWNSLSNLFDLFKKIPYLDQSLFDFTTFVVVSEFSRLPFLNGTYGKDHNPLTNSVLFAGKNIVGNRQTGVSRILSRSARNSISSVHTALPINFITGQVNIEANEDFKLMTAGNLASSIRAILKSPNTDFKNFSTIPGLVKT